MIVRSLSAGRRYVAGLSTDARAGLSGLGWTTLAHGLQIVLRLGSSLVLTRLLMPEVYGIFGPAMAVLFFLEFLSDIGLRPAVGRSPNGESPEFLGTAWTIVVFRAIGLAGVAAGLSFVLPALYDKPAMGWVLLVLAARPILLAFVNPTLFVLFRRLNYRPAFVLDVTQTVLVIPVTIALAVWLENVWALVLGVLIGDVYRVAMTHVVCPPAPRFRWHRPSVYELTHFGTSIFFNTMAYGAWVYFDRLTGPLVLSTFELGLYTAAFTLSEALENLIGRANEVFYSMLSRKGEGGDRRAFFERTVRRLAIFGLPAIALAAVFAPIAYRLLYPVQFHGAAILLGLLTARLALRAIGQMQFMYLMMRGEVIVATRAYLFSLALLVIGFGSFWLASGSDAFTPLLVALGTVGAMATYVIAQSVPMVLRGEAKPGPVLIGLGWTAVAVAGVLLISK